ncbi:MAG: FG-GAP-like repeat-containing protein [Planctomycetota bacterium]|jgi:hypothetical protein
MRGKDFLLFSNKRTLCLSILVLAGGFCLVCSENVFAIELQWDSPNQYRIAVTADPGSIARTNSPTEPLWINFHQEIGGSATFDEHTIEVIAYNYTGEPMVYDPSRTGYQQYLVPWRLEKYYGIEEVQLIFVMPDHGHRQYAVYFDTVESGRGRPDRYHGLVGDGDRFRQGYGRREIGPSKFGDMCDFDGDGDMDYFQGGVEPFIYCYENIYDQIGEQKLVERGKLTSGGQVFLASRNSSSNRSWLTVTFHDWDGDGDQDLFTSCNDGPDCGHILYYRNTTTPGGQPTFARVGRMNTVSGESIGRGCGAGWFPTPTFVEDWDGNGDGRSDIIIAQSGYLYLHRNLGPGGTTEFLLDNGIKLQANGSDIELLTPRVDCADMDGDGDLDLIATTHGTELGWANAAVIIWFKNIGTRQNPLFEEPTVIGAMRHHYSGVKIGDFYGNDGLPDVAVGTFWLANEKHGYPKSFGGLVKNLGPLENPTFEIALADSGSLYTEQFQICDAGQQNGVRSLDWDNDGDHDLVASTVDGLIQYYRNLNNNLYPVFAPPHYLMVGGANPTPIVVDGPEGGYARHDMSDWNNDGLMDLVVGDEEARVFTFLNDGLGNDPPTFLPGNQLWANNKPLDCLKRGSPLVCDWNNDGKKDLVFGMTPKQTDYETPYDWPYQDGDTNKTDDQGFLFYKNVGTDDDPELAYPSWLRAEGDIITYTRPNLGSFVDWDGDGIKDLIACQFESNVLFYKNIGSGSPNQEPQLWPKNGTVLVEPFCKTQMVSGADALDFNGDGDLDILTGQGHSGSGLKFYERDYIEDWQNNTFPAVSFGTVPDDFTPPQEVRRFVADKQSDTSVKLIWGTPSDTDYYYTMIRYGTDTYPSSVTDGELVCKLISAPNSINVYTHAITPLQSYYYTAFGCDAAGNYTAGVVAKATLVWCYETFDDYYSGNLDGQGGWTKDDPDINSCYVTSSASADPSGYGVRLPYYVDSEAIQADLRMVNRGYHKFSFDMRRAGGAARAYIELSGNGATITRVYWDSNYQILTGPGETYTDLVINPSTNSWYHIELGIDLDKHTIDAWADGVQKVYTQPFHELTSRISHINLVGYNWSGNSAYVDNLLGMRISVGCIGDFNFDNDVDQEDFGYLQACFSGDGGISGKGCENSDFDNDGDVDGQDLRILQDCSKGANAPPPLECFPW